MKIFIFIRGYNTSYKQQFVKNLMNVLNPSPDHISAIKVSINDFIKKDEWKDKAKIKAAYKSTVNIIKRIFGGSHSETFIVVDNDSIAPSHWQSYFNISEVFQSETPSVGIDIFNYENMFKDENISKINLQEQNSAIFNASLYKYYRINISDDEIFVLKEFKNLMENIKNANRGTTENPN